MGFIDNQYDIIIGLVKKPLQFDVRMEYIIIIADNHVAIENTIQRNFKGADSMGSCHFSNIPSINDLFSEHFRNNLIQ
ncbi:hypothetical protein ES703_125046 [subsurface metagenome]